MKRIIRDRLLTPEEAAENELIRKQVAKDFPPKYQKPMTKEKQRQSLSIVCELINQVPAMSDADLLKEIQRRFPAVVGTGRESRETMILWLIKDELYNQFDPGFMPRKHLTKA
jgi:hypothetical protein